MVKSRPKAMRVRGGKTMSFQAGKPFPKPKMTKAISSIERARALREMASGAALVASVIPGVAPLMMGAKAYAKSYILGHIINGTGDFVLDKVGKVPSMIGAIRGKKPGKTGGSPVRDAKIVASDNGVGAVMGVYEGVMPNHDGIKIHKFNERVVDGGKDAKLVLAKTLYNETTVNYFSTTKSVYSRLYALAGLNSKGVVYPYQTMGTAPAYTAIDTLAETALIETSAMYGESLIDIALMLKKALLPVGSPAGALTDMPPLATGDIDYMFPIQKWKAVYKITNTNSFMPVKLKIYVVQARRDTTLCPCDVWFTRLSPAGGGETSRMNQLYVDRQVQEPIVGISPPAAVQPYTEVSLHPQASPGMSPKFKDTYKILSVRNFNLKASDQLEFTLEHIYNKCLSAAEYNTAQLNGNLRYEGQLDIMIEFQGMPTPFYLSGSTANTVTYSAMADTSFAKIRYTVDKYFTHSFPVSQGLGLYNPLGAQYTPSFIGTVQRPLVQYTEKTAYSNFTADPSAIGKYLIPLVTPNNSSFAKPLVNDPI